MILTVRVGIIAALVTIVSVFLPSLSIAAEKAFDRPNLAEAAIKLEAEIKSDAGASGKPVAQIRPPRRKADRLQGSSRMARTGSRMATRGCAGG